VRPLQQGQPLRLPRTKPQPQQAQLLQPQLLRQPLQPQAPHRQPALALPIPRPPVVFASPP
jgi:hypothetical protein